VDETEGHAFAVYASDGSPSSLAALLAWLQDVDVVLFGEYHDDPVVGAAAHGRTKRGSDFSAGVAVVTLRHGSQ
jgi:hypothetical protein